jgi:hypothetical protein
MALNVVMESGTVCSLSERFSAVTVIVSSSFDGAAVSAANTRNDPIIAATPAHARQFFDVPIGILPAKRRTSIPHSLTAYRRDFINLKSEKTFAAAFASPIQGTTGSPHRDRS